MNITKSENIIKFELEVNNLPCWHWVEVKETMLPLAKKVQKGDNIDIAKFGRIIISGWGNNAPCRQEVLEKLRNN